ncbi:MAG: hypothetical protein A2Z20_10245 [Bdellovibrionales bacterium RBG_16_40_8]|nr:MAG: hypothetical protein A2Z20_10245 [Bdellovibrionales bacterium RBG_16_40_8]
MGAFKLEETDNVNIIRCPAKIELTRELESAMQDAKDRNAAIHILDFSAVSTFNEKAYRPLVMFNQFLKASGKRLFGMNASDEIQRQLKKDGLSAVFPFIKSKEEALTIVNPRKSIIDVEFLNAFINATQKVLLVQANTSLTCGKPYPKTPNINMAVDLIGHFDLKYSGHTLSVALGFNNKVFLKIYENMVSEKHTEITAELQDAAGEILNIIFGQAKITLNDRQGHSLDKAIPSVLTGDKITTFLNRKSRAFILPFESADGEFYLEIGIIAE